MDYQLAINMCEGFNILLLCGYSRLFIRTKCDGVKNGGLCDGLHLIDVGGHPEDLCENVACPLCHVGDEFNYKDKKREMKRRRKEAATNAAIAKKEKKAVMAAIAESLSQIRQISQGQYIEQPPASLQTPGQAYAYQDLPAVGGQPMGSMHNTQLPETSIPGYQMDQGQYAAGQTAGQHYAAQPSGFPSEEWRYGEQHLNQPITGHQAGPMIPIVPMTPREEKKEARKAQQRESLKRERETNDEERNEIRRAQKREGAKRAKERRESDKAAQGSRKK